MRALFAVTVLLGAGLMFWLELLVGRLVLPALGGTAAVWNTCLFFFQGVLLLGYGYAHLARRLPARGALALHGVLLLAPWVVLPVGLPAAWSPDPARPIAGLLGVLAVTVGLPFLVVAAGAPLLQAWYARLGREDSRDPYWLFAASNLGSALGLLGYPLLIEPWLGLARQAQVWALGYGLLVLATLGCGAALIRAGRAGRAEATTTDAAEATTAPSRREVARWVVLAFVPACLLYGVTTALTTDVAPVPLLWVAPLALYLLSFVVAFRWGTVVPRNLLAGALGVTLALLIMTRLAAFAALLWVVLGLHLLGVFGASLLLHADLARARPPVAHLTRYYLWVAGGGALAGVFCGLVAPLVFPSVLEYPWALLLALLLLPDDRAAEHGLRPPGGARRVLWSLFLAVGILIPFLGAGLTPAGAGGTLLALVCLLPVAGAVAAAFPAGRWRAAAWLALAFLCGQASFGAATLLHRERSFYGVHRVVEAGGLRVYVSGRIVHGRQPLDAARRREPVSYYFRGGPLGQPVAWRAAGPAARVGVLGLGIGGLSAYAQPGQTWRYYELDPTVARIARDPRWFDYLAGAPCPTEVALGDARRSLAAEAERGEEPWDLLVIDVFASESVPVHLLTAEAFATYLDRLAPGGLLLANVSNHYVDLVPLFAGAAARHGLVGRVRVERVDAEGRRAGWSSAQAVALARRAADLGPLLEDGRWTPLEASRAVTWTDDHVDLLQVLRR